MDYNIDMSGDSRIYLDIQPNTATLDAQRRATVQIYSNGTWVVNGVPDGLSSGDLIISNGDFQRVDPLERNIFLLLSTLSGTWKNSPLTGAGLIREKNSSLTASVGRDIEVQLRADGYPNARVTIKDNIIDITI